jgi:cell shape-determining protein MreC
VGSVVDWMRGIYGYIYQYDKLVAENETLRRQLAEAQDQVRASAEAAEENIRLRTLLGYLEKNTSFVTESAMITS